MNEKRKFTRIQFDANATLSNQHGTWDTKVIDLSLKGALVEKPDAGLSDGEALVLDLILADNVTHIQMHAKIAHVDAETIGLVCDNIDVDSVSHLRRFVELNTGSQALLEREIDALVNFNES